MGTVREGARADKAWSTGPGSIKRNSNSNKTDIQSYGRIRVGVSVAFGSDWVDIRTRLNLARWAKWNLW